MSALRQCDFNEILFILILIFQFKSSFFQRYYFWNCFCRYYDKELPQIIQRENNCIAFHNNDVTLQNKKYHNAKILFNNYYTEKNITQVKI